MYTDTLPDLAVPEGMDNDTLERVLLWAEFATGTHSQFDYSLIDEVVATYGDEGLTLLGSAVYQSRIQGDTPDFEPSAAWAKARAAELVAAGDYEGAVAEMQEHRSKLARYHGRILLRCDWCAKYRYGREWRRRLEPVPEGWIVISGATCPDCECSSDEADVEEDAAIALGRLYAWLGTGPASGSDATDWTTEADAPAELVRLPR